MAINFSEFDSANGMVIVYMSGSGSDIPQGKQEGQNICKGFSFPSVWLRHNCQCSECFCPSTKSRLFMLRNLDPEIAPSDIKIQDNELRVTWPDNHKSLFTSHWLRQRAFTDDIRQLQADDLLLPERLWCANEMEGNIPRVPFKQFIEDDRTVLKWLFHVEQDGICLIVDAPTEKGVFHQICNRVAYSKRTHYGDSFFVETKVNPSNVAFSSGELGFHSDMPQIGYTPGVQFLHCIAQCSEGGNNVLVDGFQVAQDFQTKYPESFELLCNTPVPFKDEGIDGDFQFNMKTKLCTFERDGSGKLIKINYNYVNIDSVLNIPVEKVKSFYAALTRYESMLMDPKYKIFYKLVPGEVLCFHNYRVLHGREAICVIPGESRLLEGWYIDWIEMRSRRRVLQEKLYT